MPFSWKPKIMWRLRYGHVTAKLLLMLALFCGIQADCGSLTIRQGDRVINTTETVCLKRYRTQECLNFVETFNQSNLPVDFPRSEESVEKPSHVSVVGHDKIKEIEKITYSALTVKWGSPLSGNGRRNCFGYLLVWKYANNTYCQLFKLNSTNRILADELEYEYFISKVKSSTSYTVGVYSMPPFSPLDKSKEGTYVQAFITTPPEYNLSVYDMEPANWKPFISCETYDNGTIDVGFSLPPPSMNLTMFSVSLVNVLNMGSLLYDIVHVPQENSEVNPQAVLKMTVNKSGCYKIVVRAKEEAKTRMIEGMCRCWRYSSSEKICENVCTSVSMDFCLNVTTPPHSLTQTTTPLLLPKLTHASSSSTEMNKTVTPPLVLFSSLTSSPNYHIPEAVAGGMVGMLIVAALCFLAVYGYKKSDTAKQFIHKWCCFSPSKPKQKCYPDQDYVQSDPKPGDSSDLFVLAPLTKKTVYIMYADDHQPHIQLVQSFSRFLEVHCHCKVVTPSNVDDYVSGIYEWFVSNINTADYIIFINSEGAENMILAHLKSKSFSSRRSTPIEDAFHYGLKHLLLNDEARERNVILVSFQGKHCQKYLQATEVHFLPENLPQLLRKIHNLNAKSIMGYSNLLPLQIENIPNLPEGIQLFSAIKAVKNYEEHNPGWFNENFGTLKSTSIDSGCSSGLHNISVSMQDLTVGDPYSPVSVFEQPTLARYSDPDATYNSSGQALTYSRFFAQANQSQGSGVHLPDKELQGVNPSIDSENLGEKLSCLTICTPQFNDLSRLRRNEIKEESGICDEISFVPPECSSGILYDSYSMAIASFNRNDESIQQPKTTDNHGHTCIDVQDVEPTNLYEAELTPPETLSNIQVDTISSALHAINANTDKVFYGRDAVVA